MAGRTRACQKRLEEAANTSEEEVDERPAEEPEAEAQEAQALQPDADVRTGRSRSRSVSRSRSRSVSRSRSRSRDRSPPAAELAAPTHQQVAAQCLWLAERARERGAGREAAAPATTQDHVPHEPVSDPYQSLAAPATTQGHVPNNLSLYHDAMATQRRILQDAMQRHAQFHQLMDQMQREGVQQAAASRQRQLDFLARLGQGPF